MHPDTLAANSGLGTSSMSGAKVFFNTNVLAYAQDHDAAEKRERSRQLIADVVASSTGVTSTHVL